MKQIKLFIPALCLSLAGSFLLTLYGPLELLFTNLEEFHFGFDMLFPLLLLLFVASMIAAMAGFAVCRLIYARLYDLALCAAMTAFICTYFQGMFMAGNLPPLDGSPIRWYLYHRQYAQSMLLWLIVGIAVSLGVRFLHMERMRKIFTWLSLFFTSVLLVTLVTVGIQNNGFAPKPGIAVTKQQEFTMSTQENLVIFVIDAADSRTFSGMLEEDPSYGEMLKDFTYYPNTVSAYPFTKHAIPQMLHGQWFENQEDFLTFSSAAMDASPLLQTLSEGNWRMGMYEEELTGFYRSEGLRRFENVSFVKQQFASRRRVLENEIKLVWFKYAPWPLKRLTRVEMNRFNQLLKLPEDVSLFHANNLDFYTDLKNTPVETVSEPCFRFIHIEGAHVPFRYDENVNLIDESEGSYPRNMSCAMTIVRDYLDKLKEAGVYDNTAIVLLADHGYGYEREIPIVGRGNPVLAVKGRGEQHPAMARSEAPISYEDLQEAYQRLLQGKASGEVFDAKEGQNRPRRILLYPYMKEHVMAEFMQTGHAFDIETMIPTGREFHAK